MNTDAPAPEPPVGLRGLLSYARPHSLALWSGGLITTVAALLTLAQPMVAKYFLDGMAVGGGPDVTLILVLSALLVFATVLASVGNYLTERTAEGIVHGVRRDLVRRIMRLRMSVLDHGSPGDLLSRVVSDSNQLRTATTRDLVDLFIGALQFVGIIVLMGYLDLGLLALLLAVVVVVGFAFGAVVPRIRRASLNVQEALGEMGSTLERSLNSLRTIKASGSEEREIAVVTAASERALQQGKRAAVWFSAGSMSTGLLVQVSFLIILGVGGARAATGGLDLSVLVAFLLYLFYLTGPITQLTSSISGLQAGLASLQRIREVQAMPNEEETGAVSWTPASADRPASVSFRNVRFGYDPQVPLFEELTFDVPAGGMTAFVGPSAAGKSTVFSLVERFYEPQAGSVRMDGRDITEWPLDRLRAGIGYVEQEAPVLSGTLRENLLMAAPEATEEELADIISRTRLEGLVGRLENGLDTLVGHRGVALSGGERQRVAIARALLRRPRLLLLDEATSQLDSINEQALQETIREASRITTVMVIAHRLATVREADRILVLERGRIRSTGTHEELVESDELYMELSMHQFAGAEAAPVGAGAQG
ncbi:ABC transporter ATP-binding protein [Nocardiopsis changdeensis]|uniref:ABC transporter ATP-binding protein n=1 Tax=Nocardiopsis changdeensis TaxID=2831969 RepID=A0ABX8BLQ9_9ACTN|nr:MULTISPECIES: ABC transporter ATP-binding protein [Nocardiopsis]QUX23165.1 ABC transporter ATP-binding protein [Nocardiopsis changdeensis]QYX39108.1 ABC transporter ATP-binding protein/permease [Nocardiopsis sp. MT53]